MNKLVLTLSALLLTTSAMAANHTEHTYQPKTEDTELSYPQNVIHEGQDKTREQVKAELAQSKKDGSYNNSLYNNY